MVKIRVRTREGEKRKIAELTEKEVPPKLRKYAVQNTIDEELTPDIDPDDIVAIESEDYEIENRLSADAYDEFLDANYPPISIGEYPDKYVVWDVEYLPSRIIRELTPDNWAIGFKVWRTEQEQYIAEEMADEEPDYRPDLPRYSGAKLDRESDRKTYWENVLSNFPFPQFFR